MPTDTTPAFEVQLMQRMPENQRALFLAQMAGVRKTKGTALLLTLLLGGIGAHRFYLGQVGLGVLYAVFFWTFIPALAAFVELFFVGRRVDAYNRRQAEMIATNLQTLTGAGAQTPSSRFYFP